MARSKSSPEFLVSTPAAARALIAATRQEIVDVLASAGPCTVAQLADLLGRRPDALYFHLRALERVGLVTTPSQQKNGRHAAVVYALPGSAIRLDYSAGNRADLVRVVRNALRLSLREFDRECLAGRPIGQGSSRTLWGGRFRGWVSPRQLARINKLIAELSALVRQGRPGPGQRAVSFGFVLAPAGESERIRASKRKSQPSNRSSPRSGRKPSKPPRPG